LRRLRIMCIRDCSRRARASRGELAWLVLSYPSCPVFIATGHDGSLSTIHANSPRDAIARLETLTLMAGVDLPIRSITRQIASAVQVFVQQGRLQDGSRKITHITEVQGMEGDTILLQDVFVFEQTGMTADGRVIGEHRATGLRPRVLSRLDAAGIHLPPSLFLR
ncbi:MAG: Flp pilus assembly complex ATPase component TadA, partial [Armatimonadetes bacterium]|nr:Flp pilus assembly complex ATPase component TadA [Armatimonadota bacterium]